jgi:acyl-CoA dehydrogenase
MALDPDTFDALIGTIRRFVAERLRPLEERVAEEDEVPGDVVREMREMGLFGLSIPLCRASLVGGPVSLGSQARTAPL